MFYSLNEIAVFASVSLSVSVALTYATRNTCWCAAVLCLGEERIRVVDAVEIPMSEIKSTVLNEMTPGQATNPMRLIVRLHEVKGISTYDLKAAIWYLIGDRAVRLEDNREIVRIDQAPSL